MVTKVRQRRDGVLRLFRIGVFLKGADGILEILGGVLFFLVKQSELAAVVVFLTSHELSEDPGDRIANLLRHAVENLSLDTKLFAGAYLVGHGLIKVVLMAGLLRGKMWAYTAALIFIGAFILYQAYRFTHTHSIALLVLTAFDLAVWSLIWLEYRRHRRRTAS